MGRPSIFTEELAQTICERIAQGESLRAICQDDDMPERMTVWRWLRDKENFCYNYTRAREDQAEHYADEIIEIADTDEDANRAKVRIDARKWKAARMAPRKWGDKVTTEHVGDPERPLQHQHAVAPELTKEEWMAAHGMGTAARSTE